MNYDDLLFLAIGMWLAGLTGIALIHRRDIDAIATNCSCSRDVDTDEVRPC